MSDPRRDDLMARCWQTSQTLDTARHAVERAVRLYDQVPDGDPRKVEAERRLKHTLAVKNIAEEEAGKAADDFLAYEEAQALGEQQTLIDAPDDQAHHNH